jgi:hypothetical protein
LFASAKEAKLAGVVLLQRVQLARSDFVGLVSLLSEVETHVADQAARDRGR